MCIGRYLHDHCILPFAHNEFPEAIHGKRMVFRKVAKRRGFRRILLPFTIALFFLGAALFMIAGF